jgi:hypothetical protein
MEKSRNELSREWKELNWIMSNMKTCRKSDDPIGLGKWAKKLAAWRNAHPKEAISVVKKLNEMIVKDYQEQ